MYILDTDHLSLLQRNNQEGKQILARLAATKDVLAVVTIITYEEQLRGRLSVLSKAKTLDDQVVAYQWLQKLSENYRLIQIIPFDQEASIALRNLLRTNFVLRGFHLRNSAEQVP